MTANVQPPDLAALDAYIGTWGKSTRSERAGVRLHSSIAEIRSFHDAMLPHLQELITFLDQFPPADIPESYRPLAATVLAMCEIENSVYKWDAPILVTDETGSFTAIPLQRMKTKRHFHQRAAARNVVEDTDSSR